ncbi:DUF4287 domain-containing protein [Rhizobium sp. Td3]|nr:DUF4287 domain-containing protein [Rhizobium sp. Td3]
MPSIASTGGDTAFFRAITCRKNRSCLGGIMTTTPVKGPASYFPSIEAKYGRPIAEWKELIRAQSGKKHMELVAWLKQEHGMGHGHANALVADTLRE